MLEMETTQAEDMFQAGLRVGHVGGLCMERE